MSLLIYRRMLYEVQRGYPLETCGLLAGKGHYITHLYPIDNVLKSPTAFEMDPRQQVKTMLAIEAGGWALLAMYHSHPHGPAHPSPTDITHAYYPEVVQYIVSLQEPTRPIVNAFTIIDGQVHQVAVIVD